MTVGMCLNCLVEKDRKLLKKCSGCGIALYCSRECQKISWKAAHKYSCMSLVYSEPMRPGDPAYDKAFNETVDRWMHEWRGIVERYAFYALDLANYPRRHETHALWMELKYTGNKTPARSFNFMDGRLYSVEEILDREPSLTNIRDPPDLVGQRVRCVLMFHSDVGNPITEMRGLAYMDPGLRSRSPLDKGLSMLMADTAFRVAKDELEKGNPDEIRANLQIFV